MNTKNRFHVKPALVVFISCTLSVVMAQSDGPRQEAAHILDATGVKGGLIIHIGCGDGRLTCALRADDAYIVQGLDTDADKVKLARETIMSRGLYGKITAREFDGKNLPYVDNLVNLVVVSGECKVPEDEILRILAPRGVVYVNGRSRPSLGRRRLMSGRISTMILRELRSARTRRSGRHAESSGWGNRSGCAIMTSCQVCTQWCRRTAGYSTL